MNKAHPVARDLAAENEAAIEVDTELLHRLGLALMHATHRAADHARGVRHGRHAPQRGLAGIGGLGQLVQHRLRDRQIAGAEQHQHAFAGLLEHRHLARGTDVIDARIGTRVGQKYEAVVDGHRYAVSHEESAEGKGTELL
ncbi:hypothetical protein OKW40_005539 [Paraburkholderia sp. RAU6.4a]